MKQALQPPQWFTSFMVSTQTPAQQVSPAAQTIPQSPQLFALKLISVQTPLHSFGADKGRYLGWRRWSAQQESAVSAHDGERAEGAKRSLMAHTDGVRSRAAEQLLCCPRRCLATVPVDVSRGIDTTTSCLTARSAQCSQRNRRRPCNCQDCCRSHSWCPRA